MIQVFIKDKQVGSRLCEKDVTNSVPLYIVTYEPATDSKLKAPIDEFRIWSRALTEREIKASFNSKIYPISLILTDLPVGTFDYYAYVADIYDNFVKTETKTLTIRNGD
jgi:hypothetical protein